MRKKIACLLLVTSMVLFGDVAKFSVVVVADDNMQPIEGVSVRANFSEDIGWRAWTESPKPFVDIKKTDKIGCCELKGKTNCGRVACWIPKPPKGYYVNRGWGYRFSKKNLFGVWQPDNLVVTIKLQRVEHPIPLFVKNFFKSGSDSVSVDYFEKGEGQIKIDLVKGALLPPLGEGEFADVVFTRLKREDLGMGTTFRGSIIKPAYRDSMAVKFTGEDNGLVEMPSNKSDGIKIRTAPEMGYKSDYLVSRGRDKNVKYFRTSDPDRNFAFRIRTKKDKNGKIVSAYYGKIYGDIEIKKLLGQTVFVAAPAFLYYLNPTPLDRNLEWDMKNNLCPKPNLNNENQP
jgi:hypothetical protein